MIAKRSLNKPIFLLIWNQGNVPSPVCRDHFQMIPNQRMVEIVSTRAWRGERTKLLPRLLEHGGVQDWADHHPGLWNEQHVESLVIIQTTFCFGLRSLVVFQVCPDDVDHHTERIHHKFENRRNCKNSRNDEAATPTWTSRNTSPPSA